MQELIIKVDPEILTLHYSSIIEMLPYITRDMIQYMRKHNRLEPIKKIDYHLLLMNNILNQDVRGSVSLTLNGITGTKIGKELTLKGITLY